MTSHLVSTEWLSSHLHDHNLRLIDCRWVLGDPGEGWRQYETDHIPGAIHLDVDDHLSGKDGPGRHPLPDKRFFFNLLSEIGISRETHVIAYDGGSGMPAPRLWWLLRYFGHSQVSILDGGFKKWKESGLPLDNITPRFMKTNFQGRARKEWLVDKDYVDQVRDDPNVIIIDARASERYRGEVEPIDAKAGHIPGAVNWTFNQIINPETGTMQDETFLKQSLASISVDRKKEIICYCGSGITACSVIFALDRLGIVAKLYEGSWSDWSRDAQLSISK